MTKKKTSIIFSIIFLSGLSILIYPFISQFWNSKVQSRSITNYDKILIKKEDKNYDEIFTNAENYNMELLKLDYPLVEYKKITDYDNLLDINGSGMIGYITIDKIGIKIPIYHGTSSKVLNTAVGHLKGTSLPVGGKSTHSVLSAHSGLPSSKLFTNLNRLEIGDLFTITVIDRELTYQIDKIIVVEPTDTSNLKIEENNDYVTLVTCTPYGINTHRLLVRGSRIDNKKQEVIITSDAYQIDRLVVTLIVSFIILSILVIYVILKPPKKNLIKGCDI